MKTFLLLTIYFVAASALAGALKDPTVDQLRGQFKAAAPPSASALHLGLDWNCRDYATGPNGFGISGGNAIYEHDEPGSWNFKQYGPLFINSGAWLVETLAPTAGSLMGCGADYLSGRPICYYARITTSGDLIGEWDYDLRPGGLGNSIADPNKVVQAYEICPQNLVSKPKN